MGIQIEIVPILECVRWSLYGVPGHVLDIELKHHVPSTRLLTRDSRFRNKRRGNIERPSYRRLGSMWGSRWKRGWVVVWVQNWCGRL